MASLKNPLVSIIVNCYNGEQYLRKTLQSIADQTYTNWELIFWDNQSIDNSKKIFLEFKDDRFKYFFAPNHTVLPIARNKAVEKSNGQIIAFLDTDDWWISDKLENQIIYFRDEKVGLVHSNLYLFYENTNKKKIFQKKKIRSGFITKDLCKKYNIAITAAIVRKEAYNLAAGFNSKYKLIADFDLFIRLSINWKIVSIYKCLAYYRIHNKNWSHLNPDVEANELEDWIGDKKIISNKNLNPYLHYIHRRLNFLKTKRYMKEGKLAKALTNIILKPMGFNKLKLIARIILPKNIFKKFEFYR